MTDTEQLNEALAANYLAVDMTIRSWSPNKTDKAASQAYTSNKGISDRAARVVKNLLAGADHELKAVTQLASAMRVYVYENSLPWSTSDGIKRGDRIIPTSKAMQFLVDLRNRKREYDAAVVQLSAAWDTAVQAAQANLGTLFDPNEYPRAVDIPQLFMVSVDLKPVPTVQDFSRLNIPVSLADSLGQRYAELERASFNNAMADLQQRIIDELGRIHTQMAKHGNGEKTRLYDSLITNMQHLVGLAKTMNMTGNPKLNDLADKIEQRLLVRPVEYYRERPHRAQELAEMAKSIAVEAAMEDVFK